MRSVHEGILEDEVNWKKIGKQECNSVVAVATDNDENGVSFDY